MQGDSNIHHLDILDSGRHDLNNPGKTGNQLIINGDYFSDNGTLIFHSQLAGDDSVTDHILIKGNTGAIPTSESLMLTVKGIKQIQVSN